MHGQLIGGRYRIQNKIGEGGMAYVYVALDEKLQRRVAVKVLHQHMADNPDIRVRFFQEAQAISSLDHPNIIKIFDFSGEQSRELWMVTEILQGLNLSDFLKKQAQRTLHPMVASFIVREILKALQLAHQQGIVHRDVKPDNIMVLNQGSHQGVVIKLMDFGIAKNTRLDSITITGTFMGSPSYMSPEQIRGKQIDSRSDIYSLGVLFYECVTGKLPFHGNSTHDVIVKITEGNFQEPIAVQPSLHPTINKMILKAMAMFPSNRYQEAATFARDLDTFMHAYGFAESNIELEKYLRDATQYQRRLDALDIVSKTQILVPTAATPIKIAQSAEPAARSQNLTKPAQVTAPPPSAVMRPQPFKPRQRERQRVAVYRTARRSFLSSEWMSRVLGVILVGIFLGTITIGFYYFQNRLSDARRAVSQIPERKNSSTFPPTSKSQQRADLPETKTNVTKPVPPKMQITPPAPVIPKNNGFAEEKKIPRSLRKQETIIEAAQPKAQSIAHPTSTIAAQPTSKPTLAPKANLPAKIQASSDPAAEIWVDGQKRGTTIDETYSSAWIEIPEGTHRIQLKRQGYRSFEKTLKLNAGERQKLSRVTLQSNAISLITLSANVSPVNVTITRRDDRTQSRSFVLTTTTKTQKLPSGIYSLRFRYQDQTIERELNLMSSELSQDLHIEFSNKAND